MDCVITLIVELRCVQCEPAFKAGLYLFYLSLKLDYTICSAVVHSSLLLVYSCWLRKIILFYGEECKCE